MKKKQIIVLTWVVVLVTLLASVALVGLSWFRPYFDARRLVASIEVKDQFKNWPHIGPLQEFDIRVDTFSHDLPSACIASLYKAACSRLDRVRGEYPMSTYTWSDAEGWPRLLTVVHVHDRYIEVAVGQNNDNDSFRCTLKHGQFDPRGKTKQSGWTIPADTLRCN